MAVPTYQQFMTPLLEFISDGKEHSLRESIEALAEKLNLSDGDRRELLPSGNQAVLDNRVGWARTYLKKAGLLESTRRGFFKITDRGREALTQHPDGISTRTLKRYDDFVEFVESSKSVESDISSVPTDNISTPDEIIEAEYAKIREELSRELVAQVKKCSPKFFEQLVVDLLVKMGYGGSRKEAGQATKASGDEGIDGIIKEDRLGLDVIYLQAKRWENQVSRPELQKFAGALQGQRAKKGIFITTSTFSSGAHEFVQNIDSKIILIDGEELGKLMIDFNVGVTPQRSIEIKKIDSDYFMDE